MVREGEPGYLVDPNDPDNIVWRLRQLLENDELRARMGAKAHEAALDHCHPDTVA